MSERGETPIDLATLQADDALLDALGRGEPAPAGDPLAGMLAGWRDDLSAEPFAEPAQDDQPTVVVPLRRRRPLLRRFVTGAVAAAVLLGGAALGARRSGPDGPLWPLTQVLYPGQAHSRAAEHALDEAGKAVRAGRYEDARGLLDRAAAEANQIDDPADRQRLLDRVDELRRSLPTAATPAPATTAATPAATPAPTTAAPPAPAPTTPGSGGGGGNNQGGGGDPLLPGLPTQIVPTTVPGLPLPLPTQILPTKILPSLGL